MENFICLYSVMDSILMFFYRVPDDPLLGYFLGTFILAVASIVIGEFSISIALSLNKKQIDHDTREIVHYQNLSFKALKKGDKAAFKACNSIANAAYGKNFFAQVALSAASLWPIFVALGWMQYRFSGVKFNLPFSVPGFGNTIGYLATFLLCYISVRMLSRMINKSLTKRHQTLMY